MGWKHIQKIFTSWYPALMLRNQAKADNKNKWRQNESVRDGGKEGEREREREGRLVGQRGWRAEIKRDAGSAQTVGGTMTWKSRAGDHTLHWHIWGGTKYPDLFIHTHTHTHTWTYMYACKHTHLQMHKKNKDTHTVGNRECSRRLYNKEKSVTSRTSKHRDHHSSAYTDWPLVPPLTKNTMLYKQEVETHWLVTLIWQFNHTLLESCINNLEMMALELECRSCIAIETCYFYWQQFHISPGEI